MKKLQIDGSLDLYKIISFLKETEDENISLEFLNDSTIHKNASNINVIKKYADKLNKNITFSSEDIALGDYLKAVEEGSNEFNNHPINFEDAELNIRTAKKSKVVIPNPFKALTKLGTSLSSFGLAKKSASAGALALGASSSKANFYKLAGVIIFIILFLVIGIWSFLTYVPKSVVTLKVDSDLFIKLIDVKADAAATSVSIETNTIPAVKVTAEDSETKTIDTTGKKQIGEKATGEITLTNKTDEKVKIKKGAKIKTKNNDKTITYLAIEDQEIAATEEIADTDPNKDGDQAGTKFGTGKIKIEAELFGTDHNIGKDKEFEIEGNKKDEFFGKNDAEIDGGSSNEVKAVAQADLDTLKKSVEESIKEKFKQTLRMRLASGQVLSEGSIVVVPAKAEYSALLDAQADTVSLTATYSGTAFAYNNSQLDEVISASVEKVIPANFSLSTDKPEYDAIPVTGGADGVLNIQVKLKSTIIPNIDEEKIKVDLAGMTLEEAQTYLNGLPNISETAIELTPNLPKPLLRMPKRPANIEIKL